MRIDYPAEDQLPRLRALWQEAFADEERYIDAFFDTAFSWDRCLCAGDDGQPAAALYWMGCRHEGRPLAYRYAVATFRAFRGRGVCRALMSAAAERLKNLGYEGLLLVPGDSNLGRMYEKMGFRFCSSVREFTCRRGAAPATVRKLDMAEYAELRRAYLPEGGVLQEGDSLRFLSAIAGLYAGEDFLYAENLELLGNADSAPGILAALKQEKGTFRTPGDDRPFAMYRPLENAPAPKYFGLAFD